MQDLQKTLGEAVESRDEDTIKNVLFAQFVQQCDDITKGEHSSSGSAGQTLLDAGSVQTVLQGLSPDSQSWIAQQRQSETYSQYLTS